MVKPLTMLYAIFQEAIELCLEEQCQEERQDETANIFIGIRDIELAV